jgi:hypothetical protein
MVLSGYADPTDETSWAWKQRHECFGNSDVSGSQRQNQNRCTLEDHTAWLTLDHTAELFGKAKSAIKQFSLKASWLKWM